MRTCHGTSSQLSVFISQLCYFRYLYVSDTHQRPPGSVWSVLKALIGNELQNSASVSDFFLFFLFVFLTKCSKLYVPIILCASFPKCCVLPPQIDAIITKLNDLSLKYWNVMEIGRDSPEARGRIEGASVTISLGRNAFSPHLLSAPGKVKHEMHQLWLFSTLSVLRSHLYAKLHRFISAVRFIFL